MKDYILMSIEGYPLLRSDVPTKSGSLYTDECLEAILDDLQDFIEARVPIVTFNNQNEYCVETDSMCGVVTKAVINDHVLYVDIDIIDTPAGRTLFNLPAETRLYFVPQGHGNYVRLEESSTIPCNKIVNYMFNYIKCVLLDPYFKN